MDNLNKNERDKLNEQNFNRMLTQYQEFSKAFSEGYCVFCKKELSFFDRTLPCLHWLLYPQGIKKDDYKVLFGKFEYYRVDAYLKWVANQEHSLGNVNDLVDEKRNSMMFEYVIKYKHFEWQFSCSNTDYMGHKENVHNYPHYHFQMRMNGKPYIGFKDYHNKLSDYDCFCINVMLGRISGVVHKDVFGVSTSEFLKNLTEEDFFNTLTPASNQEKAVFSATYIITPNQGDKISMKQFRKIQEQSKRQNVLLGKLLRKKSNLNVRTVISVTDNVPEVFQRGKKKEKN